IVNLAAESHVDRSIQDPAPFVRTNVLGVQVLLDGALRHGVRRFVQVSTDEVYGSLGPSGLFHESDPLAPSSPYAASKASADLLVSACVRTHGISASITRGTNTFGPTQHQEKFIPVCIFHALRGEDLPLYGDGLYTRDWMYVEDHCRAILSVIEKGADGRIYNVGANQELLNTDLARLILRKLAIREDRIRLVSDRPGHDRRYGTDSSRIREELGWSPRWTLEAGLDPTIDWYRARAHR
ncbi:MAG: GDP-mannose 4,6-dehydratase, partial [Myxococcota bacterium]|nr:GDP-mannose 4,6-dehydratase [Myxococcota bacterium]